jgi:hypothetical protein
METWEIVANGINQGKTLPELTPRETMVLMFSLMERSDEKLPEHEDSNRDYDLIEESAALLVKLTDHFRV